MGKILGILAVIAVVAIPVTSIVHRQMVVHAVAEKRAKVEEIRTQQATNPEEERQRNAAYLAAAEEFNNLVFSSDQSWNPLVRIALKEERVYITHLNFSVSVWDPEKQEWVPAPKEDMPVQIKVVR